MTWFTRSDILEIFRDAQELVVHKYQGFYARYLSDQRVDFQTFKCGPEYCLYCDAPVEHVVSGYRLCGRHAENRERQLRAYRFWRSGAA